MALDNQLQANRENAQYATGPVTPEGKAVSSRNATRHGLTSRRIVLRPDQKAEFDNLHESLLASWNPVDAQESTLVVEIAEAQWRYEAAQAAHDQLLFSASAGVHSTQPDVPDTATDAVAIQRHAKELILYQRYATGFERSMLRLIAALRQLQSFRMKKQKIERDLQSAEEAERNSWEDHVDFYIGQGLKLKRRDFHRLNDEQRERYIARLAEIQELEQDEASN